jgi:hypothetical protein
MKYSQRDIVEINFLFPDGSFKPHPAVIDVKCHILVGDIERDVIRKISRMKQPFFDEMVDKVIQSIF